MKEIDIEERVEKAKRLFKEAKEENQENTVFWYGFGPNGGTISSENPSFIDFSDAKALAFSSANGKCFPVCLW